MSLIFCLRRRKSQAIENNALPTGIPVQHPLHMQQPANNAHLQGQQAAHFRQYSHSISYGGGSYGGGSGQFHPAQFAQAIPMAQAVPGQSGQFHPQMAPPAYGNIPMAYDPSGGSGTYPNPYMAQMTNSNTNTGVPMESQAIPEGQAVGGQAVAATGGWQCGVCFQMNPEESSQCFSCSSFKPAY